MIFPVLRGILSPLRTPMTFFLFAINLFVFTFTYDDYDRVDQAMDSLLADHQFVETQGAAFSVMIDREPNLFSSVMKQLAQKTLHGDFDSQRILGGLAARNNEFVQRAEAYDFGGDQIALKDWRKKFVDFRDLQSEHPSYLWGLSHVRSGWLQYFTYQFAHSGFLHLFWNMAFLLIFGTFVETALGGSFVILTYLGAGVLGALIFAQMSGISSAPLVGASAAVSGLMALVGFGWLRREKLPFFFWLLPLDGYFGMVLLPSWLILVISLLPDVSGYLGSASDFGSVAYSAHIGGALMGAGVALLWRVGFLKAEVENSGLTKDSGRASHDDEKKSSSRRAG